MEGAYLVAWCAIPEDWPEVSEYLGKLVRFTLSQGEKRGHHVLNPVAVEFADETFRGEVICRDKETLTIRGLAAPGLEEERTFTIAKDTQARRSFEDAGYIIANMGADYVNTIRLGADCLVYYNAETMEAFWIEDMSE